MTEKKWLACEEPGEMIEYLQGKRKASERKLRLFACACCRSIWSSLKEKYCRQVVELSEAIADGKAEKSKVKEIEDDLNDLFMDAAAESNFGNSRAMKRASLLASRIAAVIEAISDPVNPAGVSAKVLDIAMESKLKGPSKFDHCLMLRDIVHNPFRSLPKFIPTVLAWNDATIPKLAQQIYDERRFEDMPILADALMDAGCHDEEILSHCRSEGPHVKGCWVIDLLLGKH